MSTGKRKPSAMYGITRGPKGWKVELQRESVTLFKQFCLGTCGGEEAALIRAQAWRDAMVKKHPPITRQQRANKLRRDNKTGIPGVTCRSGPDGQPRQWIVQTRISPDKTLVKSFSIRRYGAEAKQLAIAERQKHLQRMTGLARVHPAEAVVRTSPLRPLPSDCPAPLAKAQIVRRNNKSGIPGVQHRKTSESDPGRWIAITYFGGGKILKSFSIRKHGEERAKALAIAERQRQLA